MSRDGSGAYSLPAGNPISYLTRPISSSTMNATMADLAAEIQDSLSRSGKGAMLAALNMGGFGITNAAGINSVTAAELAHLSGVTSAIQAQLDAKAAASALSSYQTVAGMSSYLTTAAAASTYQTQAGMSSYLTTAAAASTYVPVTNPVVSTGSAKFAVTGGLWTYNYGGGGASGIVYFSQDGSRYLFNNAGSFSLSHALTVSGNVTASDFILSSDARKKENVQPITHALDVVQELEGVTFDYKETGKASVGFIAQNVREVLPQLVTEDAEGYLGVSYGPVVAVLVEAVKELRADVAAIKAVQ